MNSNWSYSPETPNLGQIRRFLEPCDLEIWQMTLKNNRAPLLHIIKLYASFHHHMWIQTGVTVRKRLSWVVVTSVTLTFDLWPWPFAWTSLLSLAITPENFMMIRWWEHSQKGVTDGRTDGRTDRRTGWTIHRAAWSQLKIYIPVEISLKFVLKGPINNIPALVQIMAWPVQAPSHYLNQWWSGLRTNMYALLGLNELSHWG